MGLGVDLDLLTCKFTDQMSGRMLGVRADITPGGRDGCSQFGRDWRHPAVLCRLDFAEFAPIGHQWSRAPIQLGAELFGSDTVEADGEIITLMLSLFQSCEVTRELTLDIGHIGIYDALFSDAGLDPDLEAEIFDALQRKSMPDIDRLAASLPAEAATKLLALAELHGSVSVVAEARGIFANEPVVLEALGELESTLALVQSEFPDVGVYVDLTELRGFRYHTGLVFAVYLEGRGSAVARAVVTTTSAPCSVAIDPPRVCN